MFASRCFCDGELAMVAVVLSTGNQEPLGFWHFFLKKGFPVCDEEAIAVGVVSEDSPANEGLLAVGLYILLDDDYIVP